MIESIKNQILNHLNKEVKGAAELVLNDLKVRLFKTTIRVSISVAEAQSAQKDLVTNYKNNGAALDYIKFSKELIRGEEDVQ